MPNCALVVTVAAVLLLQREERLEQLEERIRAMGAKPEDFWWYLDLRRYGRYERAVAWCAALEYGMAWLFNLRCHAAAPLSSLAVYCMYLLRSLLQCSTCRFRTGL
jgi:hypothetical protein